jgi:hypothetical protein
MAGEDPKHCAFLRAFGCAECGAPPPVVVHHHTWPRGMGQRAHDHKGMPLCIDCHDAFHRGYGAFKGWDHVKRTQWQDRMVERFRPREPDPNAF